MIPISRHLINACYKFVRVDGKKPIDNNWPDNGMEHDNPFLVEWFESGHNYGVVSTSTNVIVDMDTPGLVQHLHDTLMPTHETQSGRLVGGHAYYIIDTPLKTISLKSGKENIGNIKAYHGMCVGAGSRHSTGNLYTTVKDRPVSCIKTETLLEALTPYISTNDPYKSEKPKRVFAKSDVWYRNISLHDVGAYPINPRVLGDEVYGEHPIHGSPSTGRNFWVNYTKDTWTCFACNSGGGPLEYFAMKEGLVECDECEWNAPSPLTNTILFHDVLLRLKMQGYKR